MQSFLHCHYLNTGSVIFSKTTLRPCLQKQPNFILTKNSQLSFLCHSNPIMRNNQQLKALDYLSSGICPEFLDSSARAGLIESRLTLTRN